MSDVTDICNIASMEMGTASITEINDGSVNANIYKSVYGAVRDAVLRKHPWNSASARAQVPAEKTGPLFGWTYQYPLPTDPYCLRVISINGSKKGWIVEGRKLLTDISGPLDMKFICRPKSEEVFDALLVDAIGTALAARTAYKITTSRSKAEAAEKRYKQILKDAKSADAQEGEVEEQPESSIILAADGG